ncbi:hypothetical protein N7478_000039 [Penicillium angulare]|uniref:uncharacterized protein n=1 Tax=Penicillium angulare TaxID=116970 RepID=UPI0025400B76|nr:uncharacterized protein N7478_000039 [Penicillium angulare]KAJ5290788.1 hypothetical protein N7478_000039 [Penicillium angulare]
MPVSIQPACFPQDFEIIQTLFSGYAASLGIDLTFQSFQAELDDLPGKYEESHGGAILLARTHSDDLELPNMQPLSSSTNTVAESATPQPVSVLGCVALRQSSDNWCEMKRLFVLPEARGLHLGDQLVITILERARALGYRGIRLDTLPNMTAALRLYRRHGFIEIEAYYETPIDNTIFMGCEFSQL